MEICQWVYLFILLVASQLCATFGDVGVDASFADQLDCGIVDGNPEIIIINHDDDDRSIENDPTASLSLCCQYCCRAILQLALPL